jgi:hypothetical protein
LRRSGEQHQLARVMIERIGAHRADHADVVCNFGGMRQVIGKYHTALSMLLEFARAGEHGCRRLDEGELQILRHRRRERFAVPLLQLGLRIEEIHLARAAFHEQEDDAFRLRSEVGLLRSKRIDGLACMQQIRQRDAPEPAADISEKRATGNDSIQFVRMHRPTLL